MKKILALTILVVSAGSAWGMSAWDTRLYRDARLGLEVLEGRVTLSARGVWSVEQPGPDAPLRYVHLLPLREARGRSQGPPEWPPRGGAGSPLGGGRPPRLPGWLAEVGENLRPVTYRLVALRTRKTEEPVRIVLKNALTGRRLDLRWDIQDPAEGARSILRRWAEARASEWRALAQGRDATVLRAWLARHAELYGAGEFDRSDVRLRRFRAGRSTTPFNVLGGRAAVRETLQMQVIGGEAGGDGERTVPVKNLQGVQVESHPFEEMLGGEEGGRLPMAEWVPRDRLFAYSSRPQRVLTLIEGSASALHMAGSALTDNSIEYDMSERYFARLGMSESWARVFLAAGFVQEVALAAPDLFFIDGTDLTAIVRVSSPQAALPVLRRLGLGGLEEGETVEISVESGQKAFWALRDGVVFASSSRKELERCLELHDGDGRGSLGKSAEFRYMLTQLPAGKQTAGYVYLSDPFIRRLVGPSVKVGQLRRMRTRAELEALTAGALLYRADGHTDRPTIRRLADMGYVPEALAQRDYTLKDNLAAVSDKWGSPARMKTLSDNPVKKVTEGEAELYRAYVENYNRFWQRYFDPIAVRLNRGEGRGRWELSTFILPLVDSSVYRDVRETVAGAETGGALQLPALEPSPLLLFSFQLSSKARREMAGSMREGLMLAFPQVSPLLDALGSTVHLAVYDGDPIVSFGSGDLLGAFGTRRQVRMGAMEWIIPVVGSLLTRPTRLLVEVKDPEKLRNMLRFGMKTREERRRIPLDMSLRRVNGRDEWLCTLDFQDVIKLRYRVELQGRYLVLSNLPWSRAVEAESGPEAPLNGARLELRPAAVERELGAMYAAAVDKQVEAAMQGVAYLHPLMLTGCDDPVEAARRHHVLFGFHPEHPGDGKWEWREGGLHSSLFGTPHRPHQPAFRPDRRDFGLLRRIEHLSVNMQFQDEGLRTLLKWTMKGQGE